MTKFWRTKATKPDGGKIYLFTATTDRAVTADLMLGDEHSLIKIARFSTREKPAYTNEENHRSMAAGAFRAYVLMHPLDFEIVEEVDRVPNKRPSDAVGGPRGIAPARLASIWEEEIQTN